MNMALRCFLFLVLVPFFAVAQDTVLKPIEQNGKWGYAGQDGRLIISAQYDEARIFSDGLAAVKMQGKWGFIDKTGQLVIPLSYDSATSFIEGRAWVNLNGEYGYIDKTGRSIKGNVGVAKTGQGQTEGINPAPSIPAGGAKGSTLPTEKGMPSSGDISSPIIKATYGANGKVMDVTTHVQSRVAGNQLSISATNEEFGNDPIYGVAKTLTVRYHTAEGEKEASASEGETLRLSFEPHQAKGAQSSGDISSPIIKATYGANGKVMDVTTHVQSRVAGNQLSIPATNEEFGNDPIYGVVKTLTVRYRTAEGEKEASASEGETLRLLFGPHQAYDDWLFAEAKKSGFAKDYRQYLELFPKGRHSSDAHVALVRLDRMDAVLKRLAELLSQARYGAGVNYEGFRQDGVVFINIHYGVQGLGALMDIVTGDLENMTKRGEAIGNFQDEVRATFLSVPGVKEVRNGGQTMTGGTGKAMHKLVELAQGSKGGSAAPGDNHPTSKSQSGSVNNNSATEKASAGTSSKASAQNHWVYGTVKFKSGSPASKFCDLVIWTKGDGLLDDGRSYPVCTNSNGEFKVFVDESYVVEIHFKGHKYWSGSVKTYQGARVDVVVE
jgi:hypothetical protein